MLTMTEEKQESRTMSIGAKVSPREKLAIEWLAGEKGTDVSNLLRVTAIEPLMAEHRQRQAEKAAAA